MANALAVTLGIWGAEAASEQRSQEQLRCQP